jgi:hypothetical protein
MKTQSHISSGNSDKLSSSSTGSMLASKVKATQNMNLRQNNQAVHASIVTLPEFMEAVPAESRRRSPLDVLVPSSPGILAGAQKLENGWRNL